VAERARRATRARLAARAQALTASASPPMPGRSSSRARGRSSSRTRTHVVVVSRDGSRSTSASRRPRQRSSSAQRTGLASRSLPTTLPPPLPAPYGATSHVLLPTVSPHGTGSAAGGWGGEEVGGDAMAEMSGAMGRLSLATRRSLSPAARATLSRRSASTTRQLRATTSPASSESRALVATSSGRSETPASSARTVARQRSTSRTRAGGGAPSALSQAAPPPPPIPPSPLEMEAGALAAQLAWVDRSATAACADAASDLLSRVLEAGDNSYQYHHSLATMRQRKEEQALAEAAHRASAREADAMAQAAQRAAEARAALQASVAWVHKHEADERAAEELARQQAEAAARRRAEEEAAAAARAEAERLRAEQELQEAEERARVAAAAAAAATAARQRAEEEAAAAAAAAAARTPGAAEGVDNPASQALGAPAATLPDAVAAYNAATGTEVLPAAARLVALFDASLPPIMARLGLPANAYDTATVSELSRVNPHDAAAARLRGEVRKAMNRIGPTITQVRRTCGGWREGGGALCCMLRVQLAPCPPPVSCRPRKQQRVWARCAAWRERRTGAWGTCLRRRPAAAAVAAAAMACTCGTHAT